MKTPLVPPGTKVLVHMKPNNRNTWAPNGEEGWTVGYSLEHYKCIQAYFPNTRSERHVDTVTFSPAVVPFSHVNLEGLLRQAATGIITILTALLSSTTPALQVGDPTRKVLLEIAAFLDRAETLPSSTSTQDTHVTQQVQQNTREIVPQAEQTQIMKKTLINLRG